MKTKIYSFIILLLIVVSTFAQAPNWDWARQSNATSGAYNNYSYSSVTDASGNVYIVGSFQYPTFILGGISLTNSGGYDFFIAKYNPSGIIQWAKKAGGTGDEEGMGITIDNLGNLIVTGYFTSSTVTFGTAPFLTNSNSGTADIFLVKYNQSGSVVWAKNAGGAGDEKGLSITSFGTDIYISGSYTAAFTYGTTGFPNAGSTDVFIAKYDVTGTLLWARYGGGSSSDSNTGITTDNVGNAYITGYFYSTSLIFGSTTLTKVGTYDIFIAKYTSSGSLSWAKREGAIGTNYCYAISHDNQGNFLIGGKFTNSNIAFGSSILTGPGLFLAKYDTSGTVIWARGALNGDIHGIATDTYGNIYATGMYSNSTITFGSTTLTSPSSTYVDIFVVNYTDAGNPLWARNAIGDHTDKALSICVNNLGETYISGYFSSPSIVFDTTTLIGISAQEVIFVAKLPSIYVGIEKTNLLTSFSIYPNPATNSLYFAIKSSIVMVEVFDLNGKLLLTKKLKNNELDISSLSKGLYFIKVITAEGSEVRKFIKE
jgi:hypothetical protein